MPINNEVKTIVAIVVVCVVVLGLFVWFAPKTNKDPNLLVREDSQMTGKVGAKVTLVEFGDYQCPACAQVAPFVKQIVDEYKNNPDFNFVYRNFPLGQHANALVSAEAAEAAGAQGKYFEMNELLYQNQDHWAGVENPIDLFVGYATTLGLDVVKFRADVEANKFEALIKRDMQDVATLKLNHTPTFFLNGVEVTNLRNLKAQIDSELSK
jgi:protein-disulfide isomerase